MVPPHPGSRQAYIMATLEVRRDRRSEDNADLNEIRVVGASYLKDELERRHLVYKMFGLLSFQCIFILLVILVFSSVDAIREFCRSTPWMWQASGGCALLLILILAFIAPLRRIQPHNVLLILILVICLSLFISSIMVYFDIQLIIYGFAIQTAIVIYVTILAKFAPCDVAGCAMIFCVLATALSVFGVVASLIWLLVRFSWIDFLITGILIAVITLYLMFDTQVMLDNKNSGLKPNEFVIGNIHLYVDWVLLIVHVPRLFFGHCMKMKKIEVEKPTPT